MEYTSYFFGVNAANFEGALDIFSQFFVSPSFNNDAVFREVQAVDSEDSKNRILDNRRGLQVMKAFIDQRHPYSKFSTGNLQTLTDSNDVTRTLEAMRSFYNQYYRPEKMTLSLVGPQSLDELCDMVGDLSTIFRSFTP